MLVRNKQWSRLQNTVALRPLVSSPVLLKIPIYRIASNRISTHSLKILGEHYLFRKVTCMWLVHKFLSYGMFTWVEIPTAVIIHMGKQLSLLFSSHFSLCPTACVTSHYILFPIKTHNQTLLKWKKKKLKELFVILSVSTQDSNCRIPHHNNPSSVTAWTQGTERRHLCRAPCVLNP